jgi:hypothetical protein
MDGEFGQQSVKVKTQKITLKEGCWIETIIGVHRTEQEIEAEAIPIFFSSGELVGYRFSCSLYTGVTHDLDKIVSAGGEEYQFQHLSVSLNP